MERTRRLRVPKTAALTVTLLILTSIFSFFFTQPSFAANPDDFKFESFHSNYTLSRAEDGQAKLAVQETLVANFRHKETHRGIIRAIPLKHGPGKLKPQIVSITDGSGKPLKYSKSKSGGFLELKIGDPEKFFNGQQTFIIDYTLENSVRYYENETLQELYLDVNGTGWRQTFGSVTATIFLENGLERTLTGDLACYEGWSGSNKKCEILREGNRISVASDWVMDPFETVTFAVGFVPGTFAPQYVLSKTPAMLFVRSVLPWATPLIAALYLILAFVAHHRSTKRGYGKGFIYPQYLPEEGMNPFTADVIVNGPESKKSIPAQLVAFAVNGNATITRDSNKKHGTYRVKRNDGKTNGLTTPEKEILHTLLGSSGTEESTVFDPSSIKVGKRLESAKNKVPKLVERSGYTETVEPKLSKPFIGIVTSAVFVHLAAFLVVLFLDNILTKAILFGALLALLLWFIGTAALAPKTVLTEKGVRAKEALLGLKQYMELAEVERIRFLESPENAERSKKEDGHEVLYLHQALLPYAIVFNLEKKWVKVLDADRSRAQSAGFSLDTENIPDTATILAFSHFTAQNRFITEKASPSKSSGWSSSSGSSSTGGSTGGGYAGGGGGGGGGGGW